MLFGRHLLWNGGPGLLFNNRLRRGGKGSWTVDMYVYSSTCTAVDQRESERAREREPCVGNCITDTDADLCRILIIICDAIQRRDLKGEQPTMLTLVSGASTQNCT